MADTVKENDQLMDLVEQHRNSVGCEVKTIVAERPWYIMTKQKNIPRIASNAYEYVRKVLDFGFHNAHPVCQSGRRAVPPPCDVARTDRKIWWEILSHDKTPEHWIIDQW